VLSDLGAALGWPTGTVPGTVERSDGRAPSVTRATVRPASKGLGQDSARVGDPDLEGILRW